MIKKFNEFLNEARRIGDFEDHNEFVYVDKKHIKYIEAENRYAFDRDIEERLHPDTAAYDFKVIDNGIITEFHGGYDWGRPQRGFPPDETAVIRQMYKGNKSLKLTFNTFEYDPFFETV